jgi:hypothetical protein
LMGEVAGLSRILIDLSSAHTTIPLR